MRRCDLVLSRYDIDGDRMISQEELKHMLTQLLPNTPPVDADVEALMRTCKGKGGRFHNPDERRALRPPGYGDALQTPMAGARVQPNTSEAHLTAEEALIALTKYIVATSDVATSATMRTVQGSASSVSEAIADLADLDGFEELLQEEHDELEAVSEEAEEAPGTTQFRAVASQGGPGARSEHEAAAGAGACCVVR